MTNRHPPLISIAVFVGLIGLAVLGRLLPHSPNFTPAEASALFAGMFFRSRCVALMVPLAAMVLSDFFWIGTYDPRLMAVVYSALAFPVLLSQFVSGKKRGVRIACCALAGSVFFYLTTNFAVWAWSGMYDPSFSFLLRCYAAGVPFFKYELAGDLFWSTILFGTYAIALRCREAMRTERCPAIDSGLAT